MAKAARMRGSRVRPIPAEGREKPRHLAVFFRWLAVGPIVFAGLLAVGQAGIASAQAPISADTRSKLKIDYSPWEAAVIRPVNPAILAVISMDLAYYSESDGTVPEVSEGDFWETATPLPSARPTSTAVVPLEGSPTLPAESSPTAVPAVTLPPQAGASPTPTSTTGSVVLPATPTGVVVPSPTGTWVPAQPTPTRTRLPPQPTPTRTPVPTSRGTCGAAFDGDGKLTTGGPPDSGYAVMIQSDGKIVVAGASDIQSPPWGDFAVARYNADGSLDPTFSGDGIAYSDLAQDWDTGYGAALQSDGKILVVGKSWNRGSGDYDFGVVRFNRDGSTDSSFGGGGTVLTDTGGGGDQAESVAVQSDGKIVVVGKDWVSTDFVVVRYNADGSLDTSFGGGVVKTDITGSQDWAYDVVVQPDGKILVTGEGFYSGGSAQDVAVARYNSDGSLDTSFGGDGIVTTTLSNGYDRGEAIVLQGDGKILVAATSDYTGGNPDIALLRYRTDGSPDPSFDGDGVVITDLGGRPDSSHDLRLQPDGRIVLVGTSSRGSNRDFAVIRYNANGSLDTNFGGGGIVTTAIGNGDDDGLGVVFQSDGKIVVAGSAQSGSEWNFAVARYYPNGRLDDGSCPAG